MRRLVTIGQYVDTVQAQMDRVRLNAEGIDAFVTEAAGFNPLINTAAGGTSLSVRERDVERATALLDETPRDPDEEEGAADKVRCPRCELEYCFYKRTRVLGVLPGPKRWQCHKCHHAWDDPNEGPKQATPLASGDPRPVFRLARGHGGMGLFLGLCIGGIAAMVLGVDRTGMLAFLGAVVGAWGIGRSIRSDVCSEPTCRMPLPKEAETCAHCKGSVAGVIEEASEHYPAAATFRREHAEARKQPKRKQKGRSKGAASKAAARR